MSKIFHFQESRISNINIVLTTLLCEWQLDKEDIIDFIRECTPYLPENQYFDETGPYWDDDDDDDDHLRCGRGILIILAEESVKRLFALFSLWMFV